MDMSMDTLRVFAVNFLEVASLVMALAIVAVLLAVVCMYIADVTQTKQTIRRNYPVIGRFRYFFEHIGEFFGNTFLPWTEKNYLSIVRSAPGYTVPPRI